MNLKMSGSRTMFMNLKKLPKLEKFIDLKSVHENYTNLEFKKWSLIWKKSSEFSKTFINENVEKEKKKTNNW